MELVTAACFPSLSPEQKRQQMYLAYYNWAADDTLLDPTCFPGSSPEAQDQAILEALVDAGGTVDPWCIGGYTATQRGHAIYASLYAIAANDELTDPGCFFGLSPIQQNQAIYAAIYAVAGDDSLTDPSCFGGLAPWQQEQVLFGAALVVGIAVDPVVSPSITSQPSAADATLDEGESTVIDVEAIGGGLSYQWHEGPSGDTSAPVSGATSSSYVTPALTETTSYWVRVTNTAGSVDSDAVTITVLAPVVFDYEPGDSLVSATFSRASIAVQRTSLGGAEDVIANACRDTHYIGGTRTLLLEESRTNIFPHNNALGDSGIWSVVQGSISVNVENTVGGFLDADKFVENTATAERYLARNALFSVVSGQSYVLSCFAKDAGRKIALFFFTDGFPDSGRMAFFNLGTGQAEAVGVTARITPYKDGWYFCSIQQIADASVSTNAGVILADSGNNFSYTGNGVSGVVLSSINLQAGTFETQPIDTGASPATRSLDALSFPAPAYAGAWTQYERYYDIATAAWVETVTVGSGTGAITPSVNRAYRNIMRVEGTRDLAYFQALVGP